MKTNLNFTAMEKIFFGKYKGLTIQQIMDMGDFGYVVWLREKTNFKVPDLYYNICKRHEILEQAEHEAEIESKHGGFGDR